MTNDTTVAHSPGDDRTPKRTIVRIADPKRTRSQVDTLLTIAAQCERFLTTFLEAGDSRTINPEAEAAAAKTFVMVQEQLRNIVDDMPRWQLNASDGDRYLERLAQAQLAIVEDQRETLAMTNKPHRRLGAKLRRFQHVWIAWLGDGEPRQHDLHGIGASPAEALERFDEAYLARVEPSPANPTPDKPDVSPEPQKRPRRRKKS